MRCTDCHAPISTNLPVCLRCRHRRARPLTPTVLLATPHRLENDHPARSLSGAQPALIQHYLSCPPLVPIWLTESRPLSFGRSRDCDVQLAGDQISRHHAGFVIMDGHAVVCDLGSGNGTFVNERRIEEQRLEPGDVIGIGGWLFVYQTRVGSPPLGQQAGTMARLALLRTKTAG